MNDEEKFEQKLREQPFRPLPAEWRSQILSEAGSSFAKPTAQAPTVRRSRSEWRWLDAIRGLLWPHPVAWGGLAALWLAIAAVNFSVRDQGLGTTSREMARVEPKQLQAILAEQQKLLAELLADGPRAAEPVDVRPRSARAQKLITV